jgi:hypothetical protein
MAMSPALTAMNMGLGDQLQQQTQDQINQAKKKKMGGFADTAPNGGPGSVSLSPAASMLFGMRM